MRSQLSNLMMLLALMVLAIALACRAEPAPPAAASPAPTPAGAAAGADARSARPDTRPLQEVDPAVAAFMKPVDAAPGDDEMRQKLKQRHNTAVRLLELRVESYRKGLADVSAVFEAAREVADSDRDLAQSADERQAAARQFANVLRAGERRLEEQLKAGFGSEANLLRTRLARETAEIELLKLEKSTATGPATRPG
jgi:hypothetical protein